MKKYNNKPLKDLSNEELDKLLDQADWCDRDLVREHDERMRTGRIKTKAIIRTKEELEEHFRQRREEKEKRQKKAS